GVKIACALKNRRVERIFLANRRVERARALAERVGANLIDYRNLKGFLSNASVVFTATSAPHSIIRPDVVPEGKKLLFIDLGVPPDVSPEVDFIDDVEVVRLERFKHIAEENNIAKKREAVKVECYVSAETRRLVNISEGSHSKSALINFTGVSD
ncbi:MAG: hypothetical protein ABH834_08120, partial [Candidatus Altiarchaeota archaeon]